MSKDLAERHCKPCEGGVPPLSGEQAQQLLDALHPDWTITDDGKGICRRFEFPAYSRSLAFANMVAWIATNEGHHPVITLHYGACEVSWTTHAIDGLSDNDFICAAKIDQCSSVVAGE